MEQAAFRCPRCGHEEKMAIPKDSCLQFHSCKKCKSLVSVPKGGCCIICCFTDKRCPMPHGTDK